MKARELLTRNVVLPVAHAVSSQDIRRARGRVRDILSLPRAEMERIQWSQLVSLLDFVAHNNEFYGNRFKAAGIKSGSPWSIDRFRTLVPVTKQEIVEQGKAILSQGRWRLTSRSTSGSTGMPLRLRKDTWATAFMDATMYEAYSWHGIRPGVAQARVWRMPTRPRDALLWRVKDALLNRVRLDACRVDDNRAVAFFRRLQRRRPIFVYGYPSAIYACVDVWARRGLDGLTLGVKAVISTGETLFDFQRRAMERIFGCPVVNEYGSTENGIIAFECAHRSCHLMTHAMHVEIVDSETLQPTADGEIGEVVVTELASYAWPFIRYRIGDRVRRSDKTCSCGIETPLITEICGRQADVIITPDGHYVHDSLLDEVLECGVARFKAIQHAPDLIEVLMVPGTEYGPDRVTEMVERWRARFGAAVRIEPKEVQEIPADTTGKLRVFESRIKLEDRSDR